MRGRVFDYANGELPRRGRGAVCRGRVPGGGVAWESLTLSGRLGLWPLERVARERLAVTGQMSMRALGV